MAENEEMRNEGGVDTAPTDTEEKEARALALGSPEYAKIKAKNLDFMDMVRWNTMQKMAQSFVQAGALPAAMNNANKVVMALQAGYEAGLKPIEALNSFYFVNGKIAMYGETVIRQVIRAGHKVKWGKCDGDSAEVTITRGDTGEAMTSSFTLAQARERGFLDKDGPWKKYPENMLKFRAFSMTAKFICPDALMGINIGEEIEAEVITQDGNREPIKATVHAAPSRPATGGTRKPLKDVLAETDTQEEKPADEPEKADKPAKGRKKKGDDDKPAEEPGTGKLL